MKESIIEIMKKYYEKRPPLFIVISLLVIIVVLISIGQLFYTNLYDDKNHDIIELHAAVLIILTFSLICVAWIQLRGINKTSKGDFLLRIDDRYGSLEIIKARIIINRLYYKTRAKDISSESHIKKIAEEIKKLGENEDCEEKKNEDFIYLLNFLDFLETVAYFSNKDYISQKDINELLGNSLNYYYKVFKQWICYRRCKYDDKTYYCELEEFINKSK